MKLKVLVDNNTYIDQYYYGEPAVSYYIEEGNTKILFDTGYSSLYIHNAKKLNVPLKEISTIVLSHGHNDHTGGLAYLKESGAFDLKHLKILAHPDTFHAKQIDDLEIGSPVSKKELQSFVDLQLSKTPVQISPHLTYLGEIPRVHTFENTDPIGKCGCDCQPLKDDYLMDDTALAYQTPKGLYIITGCSHSGICNIIEHAKRVYSCDTILGVIGGFHLFEHSPRLDHTIEYFKKHQIKELYPCHCVSFSVKAAMHQELPIHEVGVGLELIW
ncbi:MBL fold metallo-hydrolase [Sporanaerobium hydrogeniformans]|uniref:MBL fold metallo-hydrolase n=1 Tax=Sporanaerobium hydrogeniformans TaxID=3072179 RepID=A0AC61DAX8_9FIRM|nr:MBL fold metallo-hydrolase [Sporanaerobium hydrogeniformans]PHV69712.1 MBL fold metallo-hydrolase [Sporanaerobium hydrogeniformans]